MIKAFIIQEVSIQVVGKVLMLDPKSEIGKIVFVCVIHDSEVYMGLHREATFSSCKKFLDEVLCGKRKTFKICFGKGKVLNVTDEKNKKYDVLITKLYLKDENEVTIEGRSCCYADLWIELGEYAREQFSNGNPSRRRILKDFE
jgi:hypothetical protein